VEAFLLYRCAELTVAKGYDYFVITKEDTSNHQQSVQVTPGTFQSTTTGSGGFYSTRGTYDEGHAITVNKHVATAVIKMFKGEKPLDHPAAFTAKELMENLRSQYQDLKH
jgi:hypothetical protein